MSNKRYTLQVTQREFDAILAGLCCLETEMASDGGLDETIALVLTNGDEHEGLEADEISLLRERLNLGDDDVFYATPEQIDAARDQYGSDDVQVDDDARVSETDTGAWVQAWVHIEEPT